MGFFGVILIIFAALWLLGRLLPYMLAWLLARQGRKMYNAAGGSGGGFNGARKNTKKEGEVTIEQVDAETDSSKISKQVGQYVDYEEE